MAVAHIFPFHMDPLLASLFIFIGDEKQQKMMSANHGFLKIFLASGSRIVGKLQIMAAATQFLAPFLSWLLVV